VPFAFATGKNVTPAHWTACDAPGKPAGSGAVTPLSAARPASR
jgi:hypothetical protein